MLPPAMETGGRAPGMRRLRLPGGIDGGGGGGGGGRGGRGLAGGEGGGGGGKRQEGIRQLSGLESPVLAVWPESELELKSVKFSRLRLRPRAAG